VHLTVVYTRDAADTDRKQLRKAAIEAVGLDLGQRYCRRSAAR
jgi:ATP-dependent Clp protease adapter protein ClpS